MHCLGSNLSFFGNVRVLQMYTPSLIILLASVTEAIVKMACAQLCPGARLYSGLIHLAFLIVFGVRPLASSTSLRCTGLLGSKVRGILGTIIGCVRSLMVVSESNLLVKAASISGLRSQSAASFVVNCKIRLPFLSLITSCISVPCGGAGRMSFIAFMAFSLISLVFQ